MAQNAVFLAKTVEEMSQSTLEKIVKHYIPKELIPSNWTCCYKRPIDNIESLLSKSKNGLRICGSAQGLLDELINYKQFPGCYKEIQVDLEDTFLNDAVLYKSLKGKRYMYKIDLYSIIFAVLKDSITSLKSKLVEQCVILYMKNLESKLETYSEMIEFPTEKLMEIRESVWKIVASSRGNEFLKNQKLVENSEDVIQKWRKMFNGCGEMNSEEELIHLLNESFRHLPVKGNEKRYTRIYQILKSFFSRIFQIYVGCILPDNCSSQPIVRLFFDRKTYTVMNCELIETMKKHGMNVSKFEETVSGMPQLSCWKFNELTDLIGKEEMKNIEFVRIPLRIQKISTTPVPKINGGYCIPSGDLHYQICTDMVTFKKMFQFIQEEDLLIVNSFFKKITHIVDSSFFIDCEEMKEIKNEWNSLFNECFKQRSIQFQPKEVRDFNAKKRGFGLDDLKNEFEYLNLTSLFPEITEDAQKLFFNGNDSIQGFRIHNTESLISAIYRCQMECVRRRYFEAEEKEEEEEVMTSSSETSESTEEEEEEVIPEESESIQEEEEKEKKEEEKEKKEEEKEKKKRVKKQKAPKKEEEENRNLESKSCPKCYRSSEFSRKTNEKLRISKIECKHLKKELTKKDEEYQRIIDLLKKELEQKDEQIQKMAEEKEEIEKKLMEKDEKIDVLEAEKEEIRKENQNLKYKIRDSSSCIPIRRFSDESKDTLFNLLSIRNTIQKENPIKKSKEITKNLSMNSSDEEIQRMSRCEYVLFEKYCNHYIKRLNIHIEAILTRPNIPFTWTLPQFPQFSQQFSIEYKKALKSESPKICESLLPNQELDDIECLICSEDMHNNTIKCDHCKRRYHSNCISNWLKIKRTCPTCNRSMLDQNEFPSL